MTYTRSSLFRKNGIVVPVFVTNGIWVQGFQESGSSRMVQVIWKLPWQGNLAYREAALSSTRSNHPTTLKSPNSTPSFGIIAQCKMLRSNRLKFIVEHPVFGLKIGNLTRKRILLLHGSQGVFSYRTKRPLTQMHVKAVITIHRMKLPTLLEGMTTFRVQQYCVVQVSQNYGVSHPYISLNTDLRLWRVLDE